MFKKLLVLIILSCPFAGFAQRGFEFPLHNRVTINYQDYIVYAEIKTEGSKPRAKSKLNYYWFNANDIKRTRGGYDGKLLHGNYTEFFPDKNLRAKGRLKNGYKKGRWKHWYPNGQYKEVIKWRKKGRIGKFKQYNEEGELTRKGKYKNEKYNGIIKEYSGAEIERKKYKKGEEIVKERNLKKSKKRNRKKIEGDTLKKKSPKLLKRKNHVKNDSIITNADDLKEKRKSRKDKSVKKDETGKKEEASKEDVKEKKKVKKSEASTENKEKDQKTAETEFAKKKDEKSQKRLKRVRKRKSDQ